MYGDLKRNVKKHCSLPGTKEEVLIGFVFHVYTFGIDGVIDRRVDVEST